MSPQSQGNPMRGRGSRTRQILHRIWLAIEAVFDCTAPANPHDPDRRNKSMGGLAEATKRDAMLAWTKDGSSRLISEPQPERPCDDATPGSHCEDPNHHSNGAHGRAGRSRQGSGVPGLRRFQLCYGHRTIRRWRPRSNLISGSGAADEKAPRNRGAAVTVPPGFAAHAPWMRMRCPWMVSIQSSPSFLAGPRSSERLFRQNLGQN